MTLDMFNTAPNRDANGPTIAPDPPREVIPIRELASRLEGAGWPAEQVTGLMTFLKEAAAIKCPRYVVEVHPDHALLVEPAWTFDPVKERPMAKPIEEGHFQRYWRRDLRGSWVRGVGS